MDRNKLKADLERLADHDEYQDIREYNLPAGCCFVRHVISALCPPAEHSENDGSQDSLERIDEIENAWFERYKQTERKLLSQLLTGNLVAYALREGNVLTVRPTFWRDADEIDLHHHSPSILPEVSTVHLRINDVVEALIPDEDLDYPEFVFKYMRERYSDQFPKSNGKNLTYDAIIWEISTNTGLRVGRTSFAAGIKKYNQWLERSK